MFRFPWGDFHSLNLGWFLQKFNELREDWATAKAGIDGALDAEIQKAEDALTDVFAARDAAAASASAANSSALNASQSSLASMDARDQSRAARDAAQQAATNAAASETAAGNSATAASNSAGAAATSATQAGQSATAAGNSAAAAAGSATAAGDSATAAEESAQSAEEAAEAAQRGAVIKSVENVPVASVDDALDGNVAGLVIAIAPVQAGTGVPSPDNVRPISGWTGANVYRSGADTSNPTTYFITLPAAAGIVYGGTLDVTKGVLTLLRGIIDLGDSDYSKSSSIVNGFVTISNMPENFPIAPNSFVVPNWLCSQYEITSNNALDNPSTDYSIGWRVSGNKKGVIIKDSTYSSYYTNNDMASFKAAMSGVQLVYDLTTPITYTLTPTEVETLLGQNNIWADTGNVILLRYYADGKGYIDEQDGFIKALIARELNEMKAETALSVNDFRIVNNTLYRITAPVASGATLTPGTNCEATTVTAILKTLLT